MSVTSDCLGELSALATAVLLSTSGSAKLLHTEQLYKGYLCYNPLPLIGRTSQLLEQSIIG